LIAYQTTKQRYAIGIFRTSIMKRSSHAAGDILEVYDTFALPDCGHRRHR
jgi:hypothetical protein